MDTPTKVALVAATLSIGCTPTYSVKEIVLNEPAYVSKHFSVGALASKLKDSIPLTPGSDVTKKTTITFVASVEEADGKKRREHHKITWSPAGGELILRVEELLINDVPARRMYALTYKGYADLKWQYVPLQAQSAGPIQEVKDITGMNPIPSETKKAFVFDYAVGQANERGSGASRNIRLSCVTTGQINAHELDDEFEGAALQFNCESISLDTHIVINRSKWVYLQKYGFAYQTELADAFRKVVIEVEQIN